MQLGFRGVGAAAIGQILAAAWTPWALKPLLGPLVDRISFGRYGRLRPFLFLAELGMALSLLSISRVDPVGALRAFTALVFIHNVFAATQDVATDAMALRMLAPQERARGSSIMSASKLAGSLVGGGLSWVGSQAGWTAAYAAAILLLILPLVLVFRCSEPPAGPVSAGLMRELGRAFRLRGTIAACIYVTLAASSEYFLQPMGVPLYRNLLHFTEVQVNTLQTALQAAMLAGAVLGGWLADRLGRRQCLVVGGLSLASAEIVLSAMRSHWGSLPFMVGFTVAVGICSGLMQTACIALLMDLTNPAAGATHFQLFVSIANLRGTWAPFLGGHLAERTAPQTMFALGGVLELLALPLLLAINIKTVRRALGLDEPLA